MYKKYQNSTNGYKRLSKVLKMDNVVALCTLSGNGFHNTITW